MTTIAKKQRINITAEPDLQAALFALAKRDSIPVTTKAEELIRLGLEIEEDIALMKIVTERTRVKTKYLTHAEVWK